MGLILVGIFALYPSVASIYGVGTGLAVLTLGVICKPTKGAWFIVGLAAALGYWRLWFGFIG